MNPEDVQRLIDAAEPEDRLGIVHSYIMEKSWTSKFPSPHKDVILPRHILGLGTSSATIASSANKAQSDQTIRLVVSPLQGGPYSVVGDSVKGDGTLAQPVMAHLSGLASGTTYWFVVQIVNQDGSIALQSEESSFTTVSHNPQVSWATNIRMTTATITGTASLGLTDLPSLLYSKMGEDDYTVLPGLSAQLTDLVPNTEYVFYLQVTDPQGNVLGESGERDFTTLDFVIDCDVSNVLGSSTVISGTASYVEPDHSIQLVYKLQGQKYQTVETGVFKGENVKAQVSSSRVSGLKSESRYVAKAQVVNAEGTILYESKEQPFRTPSFEPLISAIDVKAATVNLITAAKNISPEDRTSILFDGKEIGTSHASLLDLIPDTEYTAKFEVGDDSSTISFKTKSHNPEAIDVLNLKDRMATLIGTAVYVQRKGYARFAWGKERGEYPNKTELLFGDDSELQKFAFLVFGLEPETEHYFVLQVIASDGVTITAQSDELSFVTTQANRMRRSR